MQLPAAARTKPPASASGSTPEVAGLVDNATEDRLYGWAFDHSRPGHRLTVELRLGDEPLGRTTADLARPDLAQNGIGDGCHAFEFAVTPDEMAHAGEFSAIVITTSGQEVPLPIRIRQHQQQSTPQKPAEPVAHAHLIETRRMRQVVSTLTERLASLPDAATIQALLGQNASVADQVRTGVQALDQRLGMLPDGELVQQVTLQQGLLAERLQALEVWMARLDRRLAETPEAAVAARRIDPWQIVLFSALGVALVGAVAVGLFLRSVQ